MFISPEEYSEQVDIGLFVFGIVAVLLFILIRYQEKKSRKI